MNGRSSRPPVFVSGSAFNVKAPLRELVDEAVSLVGPQAQDKSVRLGPSVEPDTLGICADAKALRQILLNLTSNALKFTPRAGGSICRRGSARTASC